MTPIRKDTLKGRQDNIEGSVSDILKIRNLLTPKEEAEIHHQFRSISWIPSCQVLWSGMPREQAQSWADERGMQTLTTVMGPLMDLRVSSCPRNSKSNNAWSKYVHGASAIFAWHIAMEDVVTVLCPPPPQRFHPSGLTSFQTIEEPIMRAAIADGAALRIELVHPLAKGAEDVRYQLWPVDEVDIWTESYGTHSCYKYVWRMTKGGSPAVATNQVAKSKVSAPKTEEKIEKKPIIAKMTTTTCQSAVPKKSKKKKKTSNKARSRCTTPDTVGGPSWPATLPQTAGIECTNGPPLSLTNNLSTNNCPLPGKRNRLSKKERAALKSAENHAKTEALLKKVKKYKAKATQKPSLVPVLCKTWLD